MEHTEQKEIRSITAELRLDQPTDQPTKIVGLAARYNSPSHDLGGFVEIIRQGAFTESLANNDEVVCLFNHDNNQLLGRNSSGTLKLTESDEGLAMELLPPDTTLGHDIRELIQRGDLSKMSFGFYVLEEEWSTDDQGQTVRELIKVKLCDVSIVTSPAYEATSVSLRCLEQVKAQTTPAPHKANYRKQILLASV